MSRPALALALCALAGCSSDPPTTNVTFSYEIDAVVKPSQATLVGDHGAVRPLGALRDDKGVTTTFVANELILSTTDRSKAEAIASQYGGTLVLSDAVPDLPAAAKRQVDARYKQPRQFVLRVPQSTIDAVDLARFKDDMERLGVGGQVKISSTAAAQALALQARVGVAGYDSGLRASPNFVMQYSGMLHKAEEHPVVGGTLNAFDFEPFKPTGSKSGVTQAWQFLEARRALGGLKRVSVAIIDGGFAGDGAGGLFKDPDAGVPDLPDSTLQYNCVDDNYDATGPNPGECGESKCDWHGQGSASVVAAVLNNRAGAAGTGGQVVDPILIKFDSSFGSARYAIRTAHAWGAEIISMSFGASCNAVCRAYVKIKGDSYLGDLEDARGDGIVLVAAAGNSAEDSDESNKYPCIHDGVLCVGALASGKNTRASYSNYGGKVDLYSPSNVPTMPSPVSGHDLPSFGGTSAACPFVAGVVAMMKGVKPTLTPDEVDSLLQSTAWTDGPDGRYLNALAAVKAAADNKIDPDVYEPDNDKATAKPISLNTLIENLALQAKGDQDFYRFTLPDYAVVDINLEYMAPLGPVRMAIYPVTGQPLVGESRLERKDGTGHQLHADLMAPGEYLLALGGPDVTLYNLRVTAKDVGLSPDKLEVNDTFATAAAPADGDYEVNLHNASDVDYYKVFVTTTTSSLQYRFLLTHLDNPLTISLLDEAGAEVKTVPTSAPMMLELANGTYTVKISGARGRYMFTTGTFSKIKTLPSAPSSAPRVIFPGGTLDLWLVGDKEVLLFDKGPNTPTLGSATLEGSGVHLSLFDASGGQLAEGAALTGGTSGELLSLSKVTSDGSYFLLFERVAAETLSVPGMTAPLSELSFKLTFKN
jgi:hypothetical protein